MLNPKLFQITTEDASKRKHAVSHGIFGSGVSAFASSELDMGGAQQRFLRFRVMWVYVLEVWPGPCGVASKVSVEGTATRGITHTDRGEAKAGRHETRECGGDRDTMRRDVG